MHSPFKRIKQKGKRRVKKLAYNSKIIQKTKIMASSPITSWQIDEEAMEIVTGLCPWTPKSVQMVTVVMKLKDACSLGEKL